VNPVNVRRLSPAVRQKSLAVLGETVLEDQPSIRTVGIRCLGRNTAWPGSVRQTDVVSVSPGSTGAVNRAAMALIFDALPPPSSATSTRPATP
jgi:hypothetical protein